MRILLITSNLPYPPTTGGKIRVWHLLQQIAKHHEVTLLSLLDSSGEVKYVPQLERLCAQIECVIKERQRPRGKLLLQLLRTMLAGQPPRNGIAYYEEMRQKVQEVTNNQSFDIVHIEQSHMAPYVEFVSPADRVPSLITLYDVGAIQCKRILKVQSDLRNRFWTWLDWLFLRRWEPTYLAHHFDRCIVVSSVDKDSLQQANPALNLVVVPNGVNAARYNPLPELPGSEEILIIGKMDYAPNVDSALFFCKEIFPLVQAQVPQARVLVVGADPLPEVRALAADPAVEITGYVDDVLPYYQRSCLSAVSLRAGSGTRLKILEAMALGRPVVSTTLGCEGLDVTPDDNILVADSPTDFGTQTVRLLTDLDLRRRLVGNGRRLVETVYDWEVVGQRLLQTYEEVAV